MLAISLSMNKVIKFVCAEFDISNQYLNSGMLLTKDVAESLDEVKDACI